jgi:hypothetical protein
LSQRFSGPPKPKMCTTKEGKQCGSEIIWDNDQGYYVNTTNHERHMCPNFTRRERYQDIKQSQQGPPSQQEEVRKLWNESTANPANTTKAKAETMSISEMAEAKNKIAIDNNTALENIAKALGSIAIEMALDRRQRDEAMKLNYGKDNDNTNNNPNVPGNEDPSQ